MGHPGRPWRRHWLWLKQKAKNLFRRQPTTFVFFPASIHCLFTIILYAIIYGKLKCPDEITCFSQHVLQNDSATWNRIQFVSVYATVIINLIFKYTNFKNLNMLPFNCNIIILFVITCLIINNTRAKLFYRKFNII